MRRRWLVALAFAGAALVGGASSGASGVEICAANGPRVCVDVTDTPEVVAPSKAGSPTYVGYVGTITNRDNQTATHVEAKVELSAELVFFSATSSRGSCTTAGNIATCPIGRMAAGATATVEIAAKTPTTEGTASAKYTVTFDEHTNDNGTKDPKQDTVEKTEQTTVDAVSGSAASFVPKGQNVDLTTDATGTGVATPGHPLIGNVKITSPANSLTAFLEEVSASVTCPTGVICRGGGWLHATVPGTFNPPLVFPLRWDDTVVPTNLNVKKFAVLTSECPDGCTIQVVSAKCKSATPALSELPCIWNVMELGDGDWIASLISTHNGYMR
jgi:hypothetical protein